MYPTVEKAAFGLARAMAALGGTALVVILVLVCLSVTGRAIGLGPVRGDFEWVEMGVGFAIFAFLPWAQINGAHARVDLFASFFGKRLNHLLDVFADVLMAVVASGLAWRLWLGLLDKHRYGETTFIVQFPLWIGYAAGMLGAVLFAVVSVFTVWRSLRILTGASS
jgi:TRAP-type C4-dicarboxylate transport system permease small subunit